MRSAGAVCVYACCCTGDAWSGILRVPEDFTGIQSAIDVALDGDTVLVSRGTHAGGLVVSGKSLRLASRFMITGDPQDIALTSLVGGNPILTIHSSAGAATTVQGLTFLDGEYQLVIQPRVASVVNCRFLGGGADQLSFEGGGGVVRDCLFENAGDDAIDSDDDSSPTIERNTIRDCGDDGIEVRLHAYTGPTLEVVIRDNVITGCGEDGIQLIDYAGASSRTLRIERNILAGNADAGLGCMENGNTTENFAGAPLVEPVHVIGNTFSGSTHGLTGGDNMLVMNNVFIGASQVGVKRVAASSLVAHNLFWVNGTDHAGSNVDAATTLSADPLLDAAFWPQSGSPCIDAGAASVVWNGSTVSAPSYSGAAPDLGARETTPLPVGADPPRDREGLQLTGVRPNPSSEGFTIAFTLAQAGRVSLEVLDLAGRRVLWRELGLMSLGPHAVRLQELRSLPAGVYLMRLAQGAQTRTGRLIVR